MRRRKTFVEPGGALSGVDPVTLESGEHHLVHGAGEDLDALTSGERAEAAEGLFDRQGLPLDEELFVDRAGEHGGQVVGQQLTWQRERFALEMSPTEAAVAYLVAQDFVHDLAYFRVLGSFDQGSEKRTTEGLGDASHRHEFVKNRFALGEPEPLEVPLLRTR